MRVEMTDAQLNYLASLEKLWGMLSDCIEDGQLGEGLVQQMEECDKRRVLAGVATLKDAHIIHHGF